MAALTMNAGDLVVLKRRRETIEMIAKTKVLQDTAATQARTNRTIEMLRKLTTEQSGYEVNMHNFRLISPAEKKKVYELVQRALKGILLDWIFSLCPLFLRSRGFWRCACIQTRQIRAQRDT
jgi:hypothetical protein